MPTINNFVGIAMGTAGMVAMVEDTARGTQEAFLVDETNKYMKTHNKRRDTTRTRRASDGVTQEPVVVQLPKSQDRLEGTTHGGNVLAPRSQPPPDAPALELPIRESNRFYADRVAMNYWLMANKQVLSASLEIIGDPAEDLTPGKLVDVFIFVPIDNRNFKPHYTTQRWIITGVVHNITGGTYTTQMELHLHGFNEGGTNSEAPQIDPFSKPPGGGRMTSGGS